MHYLSLGSWRGSPRALERRSAPFMKIDAHLRLASPASQPARSSYRELHRWNTPGLRRRDRHVREPAHFEAETRTCHAYFSSIVMRLLSSKTLMKEVLRLEL